MSGFRQLHHLLIVIPADEKARSLDTEVAITERKSRASEAHIG
jgi:hypothetical protein